jgi:hypothetical protein
MNLRWNGSFFGVRRDPAVPSGVWDIRAYSIYKRSNEWAITLPSDISSLELWLDASDNSTLFDATTGGSNVLANGTVARWEDKSGNANHVIQSTENNRPTLLAANLNGLDGLDFDGTNDSLGTSTDVSDSPLTVFIVTKPDVTSGTTRIMHLFGSTYQYQIVSGINTYVTRNNQVDTGTQSRQWGSISASTPYIFSAVFTPTSTAGYINNTLGSGAAGTAVGDGGTQTTIGARSDFLGTTFFNGKIYEIASFSTALTSVQLNAMALYFKNKWGIT